MKRTLLLSALLAFLPLAPAIASQPVPSGDSKPQIIADPQTNTVRILIDGKEVVRIDVKGLHVTGDVDYTGTLTDGGPLEDAPRK